MNSIAVLVIKYFEKLRYISLKALLRNLKHNKKRLFYIYIYLSVLTLGKKFMINDMYIYIITVKGKSFLRDQNI